ncbi:MAG: alcohol dehydrogenase catalytic domain-containing protein [Desulfobacula sp.]|jgi:threonine dehydrogenase-like Zn-dependent dehydrogenase|nr:alcohol dehydrogenase catalytic domain-containing protein [Desulfobacula sp.]
MKALVYTDTNEVVYRDEPNPVLDPDEVLLKVEATGICGSDMHAYHGHDPRRVPPLILGHEVAGTIASGPRKGCRAVINPLITCNACRYCDTGFSNLCDLRELIGMRLEGAYAEYVKIPPRNLILLPDTLSSVHASLTEPTATALHALNLARIKSSRPLSELKAMVIGGGAIGMLVALLLRGYGCFDILLAETNDLRGKSAEEHTGCKIFNPITDSADQKDSFDLVIDCVGGGKTRELAMSAVKSGGTLVHIGLMDSQNGLDIRKLTLFEITLIGVYCYTAADVRAAVKALDAGLLGDLSWVETRPLSQGAQAFSDLDKGLSAAAKIVLVPDC